MASALRLPRSDGTITLYRPGPSAALPRVAPPAQKRVAFAAAHVVCDPLAPADSTIGTAIDWETTLAYRHHLWSLGFAVAEAMDTAQRGMGLGWNATQELIRRSIGEAHAVGGRIACGAGTDQLPPRVGIGIEEVIAAYEAQVGLVEGLGGQVVLMASRALAACARGPDEYVAVYDRILAQVRQPVILHWLGPMFDHALSGYWGTTDLDQAMDICLALISCHATKIEGIKLSLLDADREIAMRRRLPPGVKMFTGDDFNYPTLIAGDSWGYSHALLGIFDAIAPVAAAALAALDRGERAAYDTLLAPTVPLSRHIFAAPTYHYKTGVVFLAYLNGHQQHFRMVGGLESARSIIHLAELFVLADQAGLLYDPEQAMVRMQPVLALAGIVSTTQG